MFTPVKIVQRALSQNLDEAIHVARIGDEPVLGADGIVGDEIHHQREDVVERQRRDHDFLARSQRVRHESLELLGVGHEVAVRQRRAFRQPCGAAGILQEQKIVPAQRYRRKREVAAFGNRIGEGDDVREPYVHWRTWQLGADAIAGLDHDHMLDLGVADDLGERRRGAAEDDDDFSAGIVELVLELTWRVERVDVHLHGAGADDPEHGERESGEIRQHHRDAVALPDTELPLQIGGELAGEPIGIGVSERMAEITKRRLFRIALHGGLEHVEHRAVSVGIDFRRDALAVGGEPMSARHNFLR